MTYVAGDFYRFCEVCGFRKRASQTRKRWDGLMVCNEDFEERHPQDFVRGRADRQNVPDPRPEDTDRFLGPLTTTLSADASAGETTLSVALTTRFEAGDDIGITLADGSVVRRQINTVISTTSMSITVALPGAASSGALIVNYDAVAEANYG